MKRTFAVIMLAAVLCLAGCNAGDAGKNNNSAKPDTTIGRENNTDTESKKAEESKTDTVEVKAAELPDKINDWTEVSRYTGDVDGDSADEEVVLLTSASRGADGKIIKDDGQQWFLYVKDRYSAFALFDGYVQLGDVYFEVSDYYEEDGAEPRITVMVSTGAAFTVTNYRFDSTENKYIGEVIYDTKTVTEGGINRKFSSIPEQ